MYTLVKFLCENYSKYILFAVENVYKYVFMKKQLKQMNVEILTSAHSVYGWRILLCILFTQMYKILGVFTLRYQKNLELVI